MNMKSIGYICKNTKYPSLADKITKICRERGAVVIQTENKPYFKLDTHVVIVPRYSFPQKLNGAKVLYYTEKGDFTPVCNPARNVCYLAVCKYDGISDYFIFHLDESLEVVADDCYDSFEACRKAMQGVNFFEMKTLR